VPSKNDNDVPSELKEPIRLDLIFAEAAREVTWGLITIWGGGMGG
jgi:hypothetical protein